MTTVHTAARSRDCSRSITWLFTEYRLQAFLANGSVTRPDITKQEKNLTCKRWMFSQHMAAFSPSQQNLGTKQNCEQVFFFFFFLLCLASQGCA